MVEKDAQGRYDFLKYWRVVRYWAKRKYNLSLEDIDLLMFLYTEGVFKKATFDEYVEAFSWNPDRFNDLHNRGLLNKWRDHTSHLGRAKLYELSTKAKRIVATIYRKLLNEEQMSESRVNNPIFGKASYMDKIYRRIIKKMNKQRKEKS